MSEGPPVAGGVWPFGTPEVAKATPIGPWEFAAECLALAGRVLEDCGVDPEKADQLAAEPGSRADVAASLQLLARNGQATLSLASRHGSPQLVEAVAGIFANIGMLRLMLQSMTPNGVADMAVTGIASHLQRVDAARAAAEVSRNWDWDADARALWAENPTWALNRVANSIVASRSTPSRPVDKSSVMRSIKHLTPDTSPSFKGG